MTSCKKIVRFLLDYIEGTLPENQRDSFDQHLAICEPCRVYLNTYRHTILMARESLCEQALAGDTAKPGRCVHPVPEEMIRAILAACTDTEKAEKDCQ